MVPSFIIVLFSDWIPSSVEFIVILPLFINIYPLVSSISLVDFMPSPFEVILILPPLITTLSFPLIASSIDVIFIFPLLITKSSLLTIPSWLLAVIFNVPSPSIIKSSLE